MSDTVAIALITLAGTATGALSAIATMLIQSRRTAAVELKKVAVQMAFDDYRHRLERPAEREFLPASALIFYYDGLVQLAARGALTEATLGRLLDDQYQLAVAAQRAAERLSEHGT